MEWCSAWWNFRNDNLVKRSLSDRPYPGKLETFTQRWLNAGPVSQTLGQQALVRCFVFAVGCELYLPAHRPVLRKQGTSTQRWCDVGPPSTTLAQHHTNAGSTFRVCWTCSACPVVYNLLIIARLCLFVHMLRNINTFSPKIWNYGLILRANQNKIIVLNRRWPIQSNN